MAPGNTKAKKKQITKHQVTLADTSAFKKEGKILKIS